MRPHASPSRRSSMCGRPNAIGMLPVFRTLWVSCSPGTTFVWSGRSLAASPLAILVTILALKHRECQRSVRSSYSPACWHSHFQSARESNTPGGSKQRALKLKPLGDRLIVRAIEEEETTASGILLPDTAKEKPQKGKVLAVGEGKINEDTGKRTPLDVAEGDEVLYSKYGGTEIKVDGEELLVLREADVLAKVQS